MSKALELLSSLSEASAEFNGEKSNAILYYDTDGVQKSGILSADIKKGSSTAFLSNGVEIYYNQTESWWVDVNAYKSHGDRDTYIDMIDATYGRKDSKRTPQYNPFNTNKARFS